MTTSTTSPSATAACNGQPASKGRLDSGRVPPGPSDARLPHRRWAGTRIVLVHIILLLFAALSLLPFAWLICATLKSNADFFTYSLLPWDHLRPLNLAHYRSLLDRLTLDNYRQLFIRQPFARWLVNSIFVTSLQTAVVVTLSSLGGFALAKYRFRGRRGLMLLMLATMMLPSQVLLTSSWELMFRFHWLDSYLAIIVPGAVSVFGLLLFRQAMNGVPDELLQAARIDGCSELRLWWDIALPIVRPMVGAFTLLTFMAAWNSFLWPQIVLQDPANYTLPIGLSNLVNLPEYETPYGMLMAGTLLSILPVVVLFFILQRDFISGLASGAVKG